jgi:Ca2+ transporting ATPase
VEKYRQRTYDEEIIYLEETLGGVEEVARKLKTDVVDGITVTTVEELEERDMIFGTNKKKPFKRTSFLRLLWAALDDLMLKVLVVAAVISIVISMIFEHNKSIAWIEGAAILVAVAVVSLVTAYNDYKKES